MRVVYVGLLLLAALLLSGCYAVGHGCVAVMSEACEHPVNYYYSGWYYGSVYYPGIRYYYLQPPMTVYPGR